MIELKIDPEFKNILPSTEEGYQKLEKAVLNDGYFTDPFITWNGYIIDGHTRYRIMQNHPELDLKPYEKKMDDKLPDRYSVIVWIAMHQENRRNLNDYERAEIHKKAYEAQKKSVGGQPGNINNNPTAKSQSAEIGTSSSNNKNEKTSASLAKDFGISHGQFRHSVNIANAMDEAERLVPGAKNIIKGGDIKATKSSVEDILRIDNEEDRKVYVESIVKGEKPKAPRKENSHMSKEMKEFQKNIFNAVSEMENINKEHSLDDVIKDLNSVEDVFLMQIRFILNTENSIIKQDERGVEPIIGFIESVINDLEILKGEI